MLLAIDVGNTQTVIGLYDGERLAEHWRIATERHRTGDELGALLARFVELEELDGVVVSTTVPQLVREYSRFVERYVQAPLLVVGPGTRTGIAIRYDDPREVGPDRIANALAAREKYGAPCIVVDFGTSTNLDVVSAKGEFLGGALAPGIEISLDALAQRAAQLRKVELVRPRSVIGKNTVEALQSGALYGFAGQVDGLVDRIIDELGDVTAVVATGGLSPIVVPESLTITHHEPDLTLIGLRLVFEKNAD